MADEFIIAAITTASIADPVAEGRLITALLDSGAVDYAHLRKPDATSADVRRLIEAIPQRLHGRLRLHGHFALLSEFNLAGAHLNSRCPEWTHADTASAMPQGSRWRPTVTRSCHSISELADIERYQYVTLSPIYPSISKPGYKGEFDFAMLPQQLRGKAVVALGGVTPRRLPQLRRLGFSGAALLGYIWERPVAEAARRIAMMRHGQFGLQYITNGATPAEVAAEVQPVLDGGCRWVQVRMKGADDATVAATVEAIAPMCRQAGAVLLLDDRVQLAATLPVHGVHLGKADMPPSQARALLGDKAIIGSTANSLADVEAALRDGGDHAIDYFGIGPLRFTTTKANLAPTLGIDGYRTLLHAMRQAGVEQPVVAIGGITPADVEPLLEVGADGVAVSGDIRRAPSPQQRTSQYISRLAT